MVILTVCSSNDCGANGRRLCTYRGVVKMRCDLSIACTSQSGAAAAQRHATCGQHSPAYGLRSFVASQGMARMPVSTPPTCIFLITSHWRAPICLAAVPFSPFIHEAAARLLAFSGPAVPRDAVSFGAVHVASTLSSVRDGQPRWVAIDARL